MPNVNEFKKTWEKLLNNISDYIPFENLQKAQENVKVLIQNLQNDLNKTVEEDFGKVKKKLMKEKTEIETLIHKTIPSEIKKAQTFLDSQKKELVKIQNRLEKYIQQERKKAQKAIKKKFSKKAKRKTSRKKSSVKKKTTSKKAAKKKTGSSN